MQRLEAYLEEEDHNRKMLIHNLNSNMEKIQNQLQSPTNYRKFYWTPDFNVYGFATRQQIKVNVDNWEKIDALKRLKEQKRAHLAYVNKTQERQVQKANPVPS